MTDLYSFLVALKTINYTFVKHHMRSLSVVILTEPTPSTPDDTPLFQT